MIRNSMTAALLFCAVIPAVYAQQPAAAAGTVSTARVVDLTEGYQFCDTGGYLNAFQYFSRRAEQDPQAAYALGMLYLRGEGTFTNQYQAWRWLHHAAAAKNLSALYTLGALRFYHELPDTPADPRGMNSLKKAADAGAVPALFLLGRIYHFGDGEDMPPDEDKALHYYKLLAEQGDKNGIFGRAYIAWYDNEDAQKAIELLTPFTGKSVFYPAFILQDIYEEGTDSIPANHQLAEKYRAESRRFGIAYPDLSDLARLKTPLLTVRGIMTPAEKQSLVSNLEKQAVQGNRVAADALFEQYLSLHGIDYYPAKAARYMEPFIAKGDPQSLYLSWLLTRSNPADLQQAADAGYPEAAFQLYRYQLLMQQDPQIEYDPDSARRYRDAAAAAGYEPAMLAVVHNAAEAFISNGTLPGKNSLKYAADLEKNYAGNTLTLWVLSEFYGLKGTPGYNPEKAAQLNKTAAAMEAEMMTKEIP